jgi:hypothetical protein
LITPTTAYKWPDAKLSPETSLQLFFALVCLGNVYFAAILATLFCLYHFGVTNPWCSEIKLIVEENQLPNIFFAMTVLLLSASLPTLVCYLSYFER